MNFNCTVVEITLFTYFCNTRRNQNHATLFEGYHLGRNTTPGVQDPKTYNGKRCCSSDSSRSEALLAFNHPVVPSIENRVAVEECWLNRPGLQQCRFLFSVPLALLSRQDELGRSPKQGDFSFSEDCRVVTATLFLLTASFQLRPSPPSNDSVRGLRVESSLLETSSV